MIELTVLGLQAIRHADGPELTSLPAQPKRFALLAYLAIGGGGGYHRRDSLAAMFWPDLDQFAARRALRNTLYHLREALGDGVIVTRGEDVVSIDPAMLTCDVTRLGEAVAAGRYEEAVDCFRGELLAGIHFANAGEAFEEWLSGERLRVAELVMRAVRALVEREEGAGHLLNAARWAQRACALAPGDESWLRRAMSLLDKGGDTGGALRLYETSVRRLATEFDATPSAETETLAARIRDGARKPVGRPEPDMPGVPSPSPSPSPPPPALPVEKRTVAGRTRRWAIWAASLAIAAIGGFFAVRATIAHAHPAASRARVLVAVFDNRTGDSTLQPLGRMAQDWLSQGLLRTQLVDVVDGRAVFQQSRENPAAALDPVVLAHRTGAALVISGSYYRTGDTLFLQAAVTDARTGRITRVVGPVLSSMRAPVAGLDELRSRVMTALATVVDLHAANALATSEDIPPFEAYRAYIDGWDAFQHGDGRRAETLFLQAAQEDTGFVAALLGAASAAGNYSHCALVDSLAGALAGRSLDRIDRLSIQISSARCHGRNEEMLRLSVERAELLPRTSGALLNTAAAASWANHPAQALALLQRIDPATDLVYSTDTAHIGYWGGLTGALHSLGRYQEELAAADRMPGGAPLTRAWLRASALAALRRPTASLAVLDSALALPVETANNLGLAPYTDGRPQYDATAGWIAWWVARELAVHGDTVAARQAAERSVAWYRGRPPEERAAFEERLTLTWALEMVGRYAEADSIARGLLAEDSTNVDVVGELASLAARMGRTERTDSLDRWLAAQPVSRAGWSAAYYRAHLAALLGRPDSAVARVREALDDGAWPAYLHLDPALAPLRARRDFAALVAPRG
ncbi:MAG TPA: BTAD domain-containing putative transcriptional regulator [Gemmatimonadales bacterium]|jgi:DNA-binding SARP family transcriptional activator/tetratricopeptide (TPR) repeat protein/TolB-like protein